jgi:Cys-rich repeat protein
VAEFCDGSTASCPADVLAPATTECNPAAGVCDVAEFCDGSTATCSADLKSTAECRAAVGACDLAEACDGLADACPADLFDPALCDDGTYCNGTETCNAGICEPGTPPSCSGATPLCDEVLENCAECLVDLDCDDGGFCNGPEICAGGACGPGTALTCSGSTLLCDDMLASCVECLNNTDCSEGFLCATGVCQPLPSSVPAISPQLLAWLALGLCTVAVATLRRPGRQLGA